MKADDNTIAINAYAKINLCLDVVGSLPGGYHEVAMILQQTELHDVVTVGWEPEEAVAFADAGGPTESSSESCGLADGSSESCGPVEIRLTCDDPALPTGEENLAWRAADAMICEHGKGRRGRITIDIKKHIPMAAGLAGGSSDCGAVIHAVNCLWELDLPLEKLCDVGAQLGSDVPFCIMGQAAADPMLKEKFEGDPKAAHCALARGRGTDLDPVSGMETFLVLSKPPVSVSTKEVYQGIDQVDIPERPDIEEMIRGLEEKDIMLIKKNIINVLENYTLKRYPIVVYTKNKIQDECNSSSPMILMSGSGPTVFCLCETKEEAERICRSMKKVNDESFWTRTTF